MKIIEYSNQYEESWLRCRVLAYLHTSMYEDVVTEKPTFVQRPSIELIAVEENEVIGLLDDDKQKTTALSEGLGAFLPVIAVHPDHQHKGIGLKLFEEALRLLESYPVTFIELYTRGDVPANNFYAKLGFEKRLEYYDVFGIEKGLRQPISLEFKNGRVHAKDENDQPCDFVLVDAVYEAYNKEALDQIDYDRYYPANGYLKYL